MAQRVLLLMRPAGELDEAEASSPAGDARDEVGSADGEEGRTSHAGTDTLRDCISIAPRALVERARQGRRPSRSGSRSGSPGRRGSHRERPAPRAPSPSTPQVIT